MTPTDDDHPQPDPLVAAVRAAGGGGPVFVVADNDAIGARAPDWARLLAAAGWLHRVRFWEGHATERAITGLAAEARAFGARAVVASGAPATCGVAREVATAIGAPCVVDGP
jgi:glycerol dehydrogenase-like iron-containing ADH family enzyme